MRFYSSGRTCFLHDRCHPDKQRLKRSFLRRFLSVLDLRVDVWLRNGAFTDQLNQIIGIHFGCPIGTV